MKLYSENTYSKNYIIGKKILTIYAEKLCLSKPMELLNLTGILTGNLTDSFILGKILISFQPLQFQLDIGKSTSPISQFSGSYLKFHMTNGHVCARVVLHSEWQNTLPFWLQ